MVFPAKQPGHSAEPQDFSFMKDCRDFYMTL